MDVRVVESRDDDSAAEVDCLRRGEGRLVDADAARDPVARNRERALGCHLLIKRANEPVFEDHGENLEMFGRSSGRSRGSLERVGRRGAGAGVG
jgi:hypothetical protein